MLVGLLSIFIAAVFEAAVFEHGLLEAPVWTLDASATSPRQAISNPIGPLLAEATSFHFGSNPTQSSSAHRLRSLLIGDGWEDDALDQPLPKFKKQALQRVAVAAGTLVATGSDDLNSSFAEASFTLGIPLGSLDNPLAITPGFRLDWLDATSSLALPEQLYDVGLEFFHQRRLNARWKFLGMVRPSIRSDFLTGKTPVRTFGLGLFLWEYVPDRLTISIGSVYLGRPDLPPLPAAGLIWTPSPDRRIELQFPRSRYFARLNRQESVSETWLNTTIGIGGNTWIIRNQLDQPEELSLRDIRLTFGIQKTVAGGGGWFAETGLAVDRRIEFLQAGTALSLSNAMVFSAGWAY